MNNILTFKFIDTWSIHCAKRLFEPIKDKPDVLKQLKLLIENIKHVKYEDNELNEQNYIDIFKFSFKAIYGSLIKGGLLLLMAWLFNIIIPTLVVTGSFCIIRVFAGGLHFDSYTKCTYISLITLLLEGVLGKYIPYNIYINIIVFAFTMINIIRFAPIENKNLLIKDNKKPVFKTIAIYNTLLLFIVNLITLHQFSIIVGILFAGIILLPIINKKNDEVVRKFRQ